jgi:hypothetical protein
MYGMIAVHASFGDVELAQMALRGVCVAVWCDMTLLPQ